MCYGYHIWSKEVLMQAKNDDDLDGGQRSSEVKWGKLCAMATIFGQKKPWCKLRMMMTLMRSKVIRGQMGKLCAYGYHIWSKEAPMQAENDDDLDGGQRSSEVKWGQLCGMATIFCQKKCWCKLRMMMTFMEVKGHQRSNVVNFVIWLSYLVKRTTDAS